MIKTRIAPGRALFRVALIQTILASLFFGSAPSFAGTADSLVLNMYRPPGAAVPEGAPPPIGSGNNPPALIPGDGAGTNQRPPSGVAQSPPTNGSNFGTQPEKVKGIVNLVMDVPATGRSMGRPRDQSSGQHVVMSLNSGTLSAAQQQSLQAALGSNFNPAASVQNITVTETELQQIQDQLFPYPKTSGGKDYKGRRIMNMDAKPAPGFPKQTPLPYFIRRQDGAQLQFGQLHRKSVLRTVRPFCKWLILVGVVFATVLIALGAFAMSCGNREGAGRVVAGATGLMLLVMSFTIWKIVVYNTRYFTPDDNQLEHSYPPETETRGSPTAQADPQPANTPVVPAAANRNRSNLKVRPLGAQFVR